MAQLQKLTPVRVPNPFIILAAAVGILLYLVFLAGLMSVAIVAWLFEKIGGQNNDCR